MAVRMGMGLTFAPPTRCAPGPGRVSARRRGGSGHGRPRRLPEVYRTRYGSHLTPPAARGTIGGAASRVARLIPTLIPTAMARGGQSRTTANKRLGKHWAHGQGRTAANRPSGTFNPLVQGSSPCRPTGFFPTAGRKFSARHRDPRGVPSPGVATPVVSSCPDTLTSRGC